MRSLLLLGVDTDAGKTTVAALLLNRFADRWSLWKPVETGTPDSETIARLAPGVRIHPSVVRLKTPAAPPVAARAEGRELPGIDPLLERKPPGPLLIESFGGPFSPLTDDVLQIDFLKRLDADAWLIGPSALGAVGRTLAMIEALRTHGIVPCGVILVGPADPWAERTIASHAGTPVFGLQAPAEWTADAFRRSAEDQGKALDAIAAIEPDEARSWGDWPAADRDCVWHPYTPLQGADAPLAIIGAEREFLHRADGRRIIDAISSWWTILHGHRTPRLMRALAEASASIDHAIFAGATHPWGATLARDLLATLDWPAGGRVFYSDNGSTAVEVAMKMAYQFWAQRSEPQRTLFVGFENAYHGDTFGAMAISRDPLFFGVFEPLLLRAVLSPVDPNRLDEVLKKHHGEVAAILIEPILQAAGGMRLHDENTLRQIAEVARRHDVLFLADEVMTGFGRTGTFWAHQSAGVRPDILAASKTLAGGILPLAATLASPRIVAAFDTDDRRKTFFHGHSFTGHPLACAVACENLRLTRETYAARVQAIADFWKDRFADARSWPGVMDVRLRGSLVAVEYDVAGGYLADIAGPIRRKALDRGVLLRPLGNVVYALPPLETSLDSLAQIADAMESSRPLAGRASDG